MQQVAEAAQRLAQLQEDQTVTLRALLRLRGEQLAMRRQQLRALQALLRTQAGARNSSPAQVCSTGSPRTCHNCPTRSLPEARLFMWQPRGLLKC